MLKFNRVVISVTVVMVLLTGVVRPQQPPNPRGEATLGDIQIQFGRPSTQGRDVLSLMAPGSYWRLGSDVNTTLKTGVGLKFGNQVVPSGSYILLAHLLESGQWELVVSGGVEQGPRPRDTVAVVPLELSKDSQEIERMMIELRSDAGQSSFLLSWGSYRLRAAFSEVAGN